MAIIMNYHADDDYLAVLLEGKINAEDYEEFAPAVERLIESHDKMSLLVEFREFDGWTVDGIREDIKFNMKHAQDFDRVAMIGEKRWQHLMTSFCKPFTSAELKYFEPQNIAEAREWVKQSQNVAS